MLRRHFPTNPIGESFLYYRSQNIWIHGFKLNKEINLHNLKNYKTFVTNWSKQMPLTIKTTTVISSFQTWIRREKSWPVQQPMLKGESLDQEFSRIPKKKGIFQHTTIKANLWRPSCMEKPTGLPAMSFRLNPIMSIKLEYLEGKTYILWRCSNRLYMH